MPCWFSLPAQRPAAETMDEEKAVNGLWNGFHGSPDWSYGIYTGCTCQRIMGTDSSCGHPACFFARLVHVPLGRDYTDPCCSHQACCAACVLTADEEPQVERTFAVGEILPYTATQHLVQRVGLRDLTTYPPSCNPLLKSVDNPSRGHTATRQRVSDCTTPVEGALHGHGPVPTALGGCIVEEHGAEAGQVAYFSQLAGDAPARRQKGQAT